MFFSTALLPTPGFQILALSSMITKTFIIQMEATSPWSSLLPGSNSQHYVLWVRALSWAEETHFLVPKYSTNPTTSFSIHVSARETLNPAVPAPRGHQHSALAVAAAPGALSRSRVAAPLGPAFLLALCWPWGPALHRPRSSWGVKHRSCWTLTSKGWGSFPV